MKAAPSQRKLTALEKRILARKLFVSLGDSDQQIAEALSAQIGCSVSARTIEGYRSKDKTEGLDWAALRQTYLVSQELSVEEVRRKGRDMLLILTQDATSIMNEVKQDDSIDPAKRIDLISNLTKAFARLAKVLSQFDPKIGVEALILETIQVAVDVLRRSDPKAADLLVTKLEQIHEELTRQKPHWFGA